MFVSWRRGGRVAFIALTGFTFAGTAAAQACVGIPSADGQIAFAGSGTGGDGSTELGAEFHADVTGPAAFEFGYSGLGAGDARTYLARVSYDFFLLEPAICGVTGVLFADNIAPGVEERLGIPIDFGLGKTLTGSRFTTTVYALPQYMRMRERNTELQDAAERMLDTNEFLAEAGVTFGFAPFYLGGAFAVSTIADSKPMVRIRAGLVF